MLFLFNWQRKADITSVDDDQPVIGAATGKLNVKKRRRTISLSKPLRNIDFPMHEDDDDDALLLMLGVI